MSITRMIMMPMMRHLNSYEIAPRKGGGGEQNSTTKSSSSTKLNKKFKPVVNQGLKDLRNAYNSGDLGQVADVSSLQQEAFDAASGTERMGLDVIEESRSAYRDAMSGTGMFDPASIAELERAAIDQANKERGVMNDNMAKGGMMGGSRAAVMAGDQDAQLANALATLKYDQHNRSQDLALAGADSLSNTGTMESELFSNNVRNIAELGNLQRTIAQEQADSKAKGLENYLAGMETFTPLMTETKQNSTTKSSGSSGGK